MICRGYPLLFALFFGILILAIVDQGCSGKERGALPFVNSPPPLQVSIGRILDGDFKTGEMVRVRGKFMGWSECSRSRPLTRSDWVLKDASGCITVTGPLPKGFSPYGHRGEMVEVVGRVLVLGTGTSKNILLQSIIAGPLPD